MAHNSVAQSAGDETLDAERKTFTRDGEEVPGFTSSMVPTLEEKVVAEQRPPKEQIHGHNVQDETIEEEPGRKDSDQNTIKENGGPPRTDDGTLFGAPADAAKSPKTDDEPPRPASVVNDADEAEQAAPEARSHIRKRLNSKTWAPLTPRPQVDADGFEEGQ